MNINSRSADLPLGLDFSQRHLSSVRCALQVHIAPGDPVYCPLVGSGLGGTCLFSTTSCPWGLRSPASWREPGFGHWDLHCSVQLHPHATQLTPQVSSATGRPGDKPWTLPSAGTPATPETPPQTQNLYTVAGSQRQALGRGTPHLHPKPSGLHASYMLMHPRSSLRVWFEVCGAGLTWGLVCGLRTGSTNGRMF